MIFEILRVLSWHTDSQADYETDVNYTDYIAINNWRYTRGHFDAIALNSVFIDDLMEELKMIRIGCFVEGIYLSTISFILMTLSC